MKEQLIFGEVTLAEASKKFGIAHQENPCIALYGRDSFGRTCKTCEHLYAKQYSKRYYKCAMRKDSNGVATDHRVSWPACGKYERKVSRR